MTRLLQSARRCSVSAQFELLLFSLDLQPLRLSVFMLINFSASVSLSRKGGVHGSTAGTDYSQHRFHYVNAEDVLACLQTIVVLLEYFGISCTLLIMHPFFLLTSLRS